MMQGLQVCQLSIQTASCINYSDFSLQFFCGKRNSHQHHTTPHMQNISVPLTGDEAAIKKYAQEVEALKQKVGMPDYEDVINAQLDYAFACSGYDVKKFISSVLKDLSISGGAYDAIAKEVQAAVDQAEASSGRELDASNQKGWQILTTKIAEIEKAHGLTDKVKVRQEAVFDMYKKHINSLKEAVVGDLDKARAASGLESMEPDLASLKPKLV